MFIAIGLFCVRRKILSFPGLKTFAKGDFVRSGPLCGKRSFGFTYTTNFRTIIGFRNYPTVAGSGTGRTGALSKWRKPAISCGNGGLMLIVGGAPLSEELFFGGALFLIN